MSKKPIRFAWEPIETAPKDGTEIVLYCPKQGAYIGKYMTVEEDIRSPYRSFWEGYETKFEPKLLWYHGCGQCCNEIEERPKPTHWAPLPMFEED